MLAVCLWLAMPLRAQAEDEFERHVAEAVRLYEDLEYELALEELERASRVPHGTDGKVTIALYKGIIIADLGKWEAAREEFRSALLLQPEVRLPLRVSPKVAREFEAQRTWARKELARRPKDAPKLAEAPPAPDAPSLVTPEARPGMVPPPSMQDIQSVSGEVRSGRVPVVSWVLLGAGVAAGGVGTVFGLSSRGQIDDARAAQSLGRIEEHHSQAQRSATTANVLFGAAGAAVAGALVTWLLMGDAGVPVAQGGAQ